MTKAPSIDDIEAIVQQKAEAYCSKHYGMSRSAVRIILWPTTRHTYSITGGPTAIVRMGISPFTLDANGNLAAHPDFNKTLTRALDLCAERKAWQRMEVELVADIEKRNEGRRKLLRDRYDFDEELVPLGIKREDLSVKHMQRVELTHRPSGLREVVEYEHGSYQSNLELAKARLGRRVAEAFINQDTPWNLPDTHPDWVARTN